MSDTPMPPMPTVAKIPLPLAAAETLPVPLQYQPNKHKTAEDQVHTTRALMVKAAEAYDADQRVIEDLRVKLNEAILNLEAKNQHIQLLETNLAEERNRIQSYQAERDDAVADRADLLAFFESMGERISGIARTLERFDYPSRRRKRTATASKLSAAAASIADSVSVTLGETAIPSNGHGDEPLPAAENH